MSCGGCDYYLTGPDCPVLLLAKGSETQVEKHKKNVSWGRAAVAAAAMLVCIAGCHKVTGGGWIAGVNGGKATFGFQAQCVDDADGDPSQYEGQFQYNDRGAGVRFHGNVNANMTYVGAPEDWSCSDIVELVYANQLNQETGEPPQPCTDNGFAYSNSGPLSGGNIVSHGHKDAGASAKSKG